MNRRAFLRSAAAASAAFAGPGRAPLFARDAPPAGWRTFEVTTRVEVLQPAGATRVWLPTPLITETPYQKPLGNVFSADNGGRAAIHDEASMATGIVSAEWPEGVTPLLTLTSRVATRDYTVDVAAPPRQSAGAARASLAPYLKPSKLVPMSVWKMTLSWAEPTTSMP